SHFLFLCYVPPSALHSVPTRRSSDLKGDIVAFPTDTVYGLGADATNEEAVLKIFEAKGRPADGPISVLVSQVDDLDKYAKEVPIEAKKLATKFWPGPLTILLKNAHEIGRAHV